MHTAPAKASPRTRLRLPHWARPDNPLVQRELDALPGFLGKQTTRRDAILFVGLATLGLGVTACLCVGLWQIILVPLSMLPIIFSATIINRETVAGRWDDLRMTPYTIHEIVGAKLAAVLYRLAPLLGVLLGITLLSSGVSWVFSLLLNSSYISVNGTPIQEPDSTFINLPAILLITALLVGVSLLQTALDFLLSLVTGGMASALTRSRAAAYVIALVLRVVFAVGLTLAPVFLLLVFLPPGEPGSESALLALISMGGGPGTLGILNGGFSWLAIGLVAGQLALRGLLLAGLFWLTSWRAARL